MSIRVAIRTPGWLRAVGIGNLVATAVLLPAAVMLVGEQPTRGGSWAHPLVFLAILPLLAIRRHPAAATLAVAFTTLLAQLVVGPLVTCGVVLPTILIMTFQLGSRLISTAQLAIGGIGVVATLLTELLLDPVLGGVDTAVFVFGLATAFFIGGLVIRSQVRLVGVLRRRTIELAEQRDRTAAMAVAADRERIGADLEATVRTRLAAITSAAAGARARVDDPAAEEATRAALAEIEEQGRQTLTAMRTVVCTLRDAPTEPLPGIEDLTTLLRRATGADARLQLHGQPRPLAPNVELSAYRIVEQLLGTLADDSLSRVAVRLWFEPDTLRIEVVGPPAASGTPDALARGAAALTAARTRAEVIGGRLESNFSPDQHRVRVLLPVPSVAR
ncbi:MAG: histidine kinase [Microlunatus sp.]